MQPCWQQVGPMPAKAQFRWVGEKRDLRLCRITCLSQVLVFPLVYVGIE